jgi:hypothetical protein
MDRRRSDRMDKATLIEKFMGNLFGIYFLLFRKE